MADINRIGFEKRIRALQKKRNPAKRIVRKVNKDGLVVEVVRTKKAALIPFRSILLAALIFVTLKGFLFAQLGESAYNSRIEAMRSGTTGEIAAAFFLDADPATRKMANLLGFVLKG